MTLVPKNKLNHLLTSYPNGVILLSADLEKIGFSYQLLKHYCDSNWLRSVGYGAYALVGQRTDIFGGLYALKNQSCRPHIGGRTALNLLGRGQYIELGFKRCVLFSKTGACLPKWFCCNWLGVEPAFFTSNFLPCSLGIDEFQVRDFKIPISSVERAILECLYLAHKNQELQECYDIMEGLNNLRPTIVQELLENCSSIKAKRLFCYLADNFNHPWFEYLDLDKVNLGKGKRKITNGKYCKKYKKTIPCSWWNEENQPKF